MFQNKNYTTVHETFRNFYDISNKKIFLNLFPVLEIFELKLKNYKFVFNN